MTAESSAPEVLVLRDVDVALEPLRRKQRDLQAFMASQLERLEMLAGRLDERESELDQGHDDLAKRRASLDEEWKHLDALVETAQANAQEIRQEKQRLETLLRDQHDGPAQREVRRLRDEVEHLMRERDVLNEELAVAQRKVGQLADVAVELAQTREELDRLRREPARGDAVEVAHLREQLAAANDRCDRLAAEVARLEHCEADLLKQQEEQARRFGEERIEWLAELRQLRRSFEQKPGYEDSPTTHGARSQDGASSETGPLDHMLTQFEAMKRDVAKHRPRQA